MSFKIKFVAFFLSVISFGFAQEGIPVYSDYLTDNYYLIHPSMAGAANCAKARLTTRKQWFGQDDAPAMQTLSFNGRVTEKAGAGIILFNDKNGYHSQKGVKLTYAYHILFSRDEIDLNQLSFGLSGGMFQSQLDESTFTGFDPIVFGEIQKDTYFNIDVGASYNYLDFYAHATIQGLVETRRELYTKFENDNLRKYLLSAGYVFGEKDKLYFEPSVLFQWIDASKEKIVDANIKVHKDLDFGSIWGGLSYRRNFDGTQYYNGNGISTQKMQYFTPFVGVNYNKFMIGYTYSNIVGNAKFDNAGYHQITVGIDLFCKRARYDCACPAIN
ncbi:type IX secretion system membrane protein PorP/SprF [Flavobacterium sp. TAB 87]|uniref:PorP/SprF family type IX secretion system membrane protein n=1 Tax=Flavobacterium sp. TAB 87 TaxID=1729581 RepID=UPI00076C7702|nr:type IX secretion system membrane protein PorP/SprF [Flavobacterium sp. TAB 87]KVV14485.1 Bacteroidetes-specific putative membrane protein [Flavobacterium sp. TAB 87]